LHARRAADHAFEALAFDRAAALYERALGLPVDDAEAPQAMRLRRAESLANGGRSVEAARAFVDAAAYERGERGIELQRRGAEELLIAGRIDEGIEAHCTVLAQVGVRMPTSIVETLLLLLFYRIVILVRGYGYVLRPEESIPRPLLLQLDACWSVARTLSMTDHVLGAYFHARMLLLALRAGEGFRLVHALALDASYLAIGGKWRQRRSARILEKARTLAARVDRVESSAMVCGVEGFIAFVTGCYAKSLGFASDAVERLGAHSAGMMWELATGRLLCAWALNKLGELNALADAVDRAVREAEDRGDLSASTAYRTGLPNVVWLRNGNSEGARAAALEAIAKWSQRGYHNHHFYAFMALVNTDLYEGKGRDAFERVEREQPLLARGFMRELVVVDMECHSMRARSAIQAASQSRGPERVRLLRIAERSAMRLERTDTPYSPSLGLLARAGVARMRDDCATAKVLLEQAIAGFDAAGMRLHAASARARLGAFRGDVDGSALAEASSAYMREQRVADPVRMVEMVAPGLDP
jgi:hypothetical protein